MAPPLRMVTILLIGSTLGFAEEKATRLPEVIVKEKKPEIFDPLKTPVALSVFTQEQIQEGGLNSLHELRLDTPNLSQQSGGGRSFGDLYAIRGLTNTQFFSDASVVVYVDDQPMGDVFGYSPDLYTIERIEVLRGAQGMLFGKNSEAGVINITTQQPSNRWQAEGTFGYGSFEDQLYRVNVSGPIVKDKLWFGLTGQYEQRDGYLYNPTLHRNPDTQEGFGGRLTLRWTPTPDWDLRFTVNGEKQEDGSPRIVPLSGPHFTVKSDFPGEIDTRNNSQSFRIAYTAPFATITSITTRRDWTMDPLSFDLDLQDLSAFIGNTDTAIIHRNQTQWSEELRLQSVPDSGNWKWRTGLFYSTTSTDGVDTKNFFVNPPGFAATETTRFNMGEDTYALFGQATYTAWDKLDVTLGTRLDYTVKEIHRTKTSSFGPVAPIAEDRGFFNVAPKLIVDYRFTPTLMLYGSTGLGFKPGGFSAFINPPQSPRFDTEQAWESEIGVKSSWWDGKLDANVTVFYNYIWDYQVERSIAGTTDLTIFNAPRTSAFGAEVEAIARPVKGLEFSAAFGYTHITFDRFNDPSTGSSLAGNHAPFTPEWNASLAAQYKHRCGFFSRVELQAVGDTFYDEQNTPGFKEASYGLVNVRVGYERKNFSIAFVGKNLTDNEYFQRRIPELAAGVPGAPLTVGVVATIKY